MNDVLMFVCGTEDFKASDEKIVCETILVLGTLTAQMNSDEVTLLSNLEYVTCNLTDTSISKD